MSAAPTNLVVEAKPNPLLVPALALIGGILLGGALNVEPRQIALLLAMSAAGAVVSKFRPAYIALSFCCTGTLVESWQRPVSAPELDTAPGEVAILAGCVVEPPAFTDGREQFVIELEPGVRLRANYYLKKDENPPPVYYGQRVEIQAKIRIPRNFGNPGAFDYRGYLARRHIYWTATVSNGTLPKIIAGACGSKALAALYRMRTFVLDRIEQLYPTDPYAVGVLQALLIGESSRLQRVWAESYRRTGTYHAIVISGMHIAAVAFVLVILLRLLALRRNTAQLIAVVAIWAYTGMCGWQIPVVRSAGAFTLFAIGGFFFRDCRLLNLLAALAIGFLLVDPQELVEASFQFSFLSVLALGALAAPAVEATSERYRKGLSDLMDTDRDLHLPSRVAQFRIEMRLIVETMRHVLRLPLRAGAGMLRAVLWIAFWIWETFLISAAVQLGLVLPMVMYFHRLSLTGLSANLIVTPLLTAAVPVGFGAVVTGWAWLATSTRMLVDLSRYFAEIHARWEPNYRVPDPPLVLAAAFVLALAALSIWRRRWLIAPVLGLLGMITWHPFDSKRQPGNFEMTMIDVGQGDGLLIGFPDGRWMAIDAGGIPTFRNQKVRTQLDIGEDVVTPYLLSRSIRRLDIVASTHQHDDHAAGLIAVIDNFRPRELWAGATPNGSIWRSLEASARRQGTAVRTWRRGMKTTIAGVDVEVLAPSPEYEAKQIPTNNDSLVLRFTYGQHCFLATGDAERPSEFQMLDTVTPCQILKVGHHGSKTSSTGVFLDAVKPLFALISAGHENIFRHPHPDVVHRLEERGVAVMRSDEWGLVTIRSDGRRLDIQTWRSDGGRAGLQGAF